MDRVLSILFTVWAVMALLPIGAWTGVTGGAYYVQAFALWGRTLLVGVLAAALLLVVGGERAGSAPRRALAAFTRSPRRVVLGGLGVVAMLEALAMTWLAFGRMPPLIDAWVQYFQARTLLAGSFVAPEPSSIAHFDVLFAPVTARGWFGQYPPVHPALLAVGLAFGAPWLVTPLLAAALPAATYALARGTGDERTARLAAFLVLLSPFIVAMDASAMNHLPAALAVTLGLAALAGIADGSARAGAVLGAAVGLTLGLRPVDGAVLALVALPAVLIGLVRHRALAMVAAVALAGFVTLIPTLAYNLATTGSPLTFTYSALWGDLLGLDQGVPWGTRLSALRALGLTAVDGHQMNVYLLEWPLPVTVVIAVGFWLERGRLTPATRAAAAYLLTLVGALFFYFHRDTLFGPRLLFSAVPALLVLTAAALVRLGDVRRPVAGRAFGDVAWVGVAMLAVLAALTLALPRLASHRTAGSAIALHPERDAAAAGIERALVLIPEGLGSRLIARLWAGGVPMTDSNHLYARADACTLAAAIADAEHDGVTGPDFVARVEGGLIGATPGRPAPGVTRDSLLRLPADGRLSPACAAEIERDRRGTLQFAPYLYLNTPGLDGDIVWARELGDDEDAALARRYPDRSVYRYRGPQREGGSAFVLLSEPGRDDGYARRGVKEKEGG